MWPCQCEATESMNLSAIKCFHWDFSLYSLWRVTAWKKEKVNPREVWKMPTISLYSYFFFHYFCTFYNTFSFLPLSCSHRLFCFFLINVHYVLFPLLSPVHPSHSPSLLNSKVRSDPFHKPEKANYVPLYDFNYFTTRTVFYYWAAGSDILYTCMLIHTSNKHSTLSWNLSVNTSCN